GTRLVTLSPPRGSYAADDRRRSRPLPIEREPAATTSRAVASATTPTPGERSQTMEKRSALPSTSPESADQLPEWPEHQVARQSGSNWQALPAGRHQLPPTKKPAFEPGRPGPPPECRAPPPAGR